MLLPICNLQFALPDHTPFWRIRIEFRGARYRGRRVDVVSPKRSGRAVVELMLANVRCNAGPGMMRGKMTIWILLMPPSSNLIFVAFRVRRRTVDIGCGRDVGRQIIANVGPNALNILAYR